VRFQFSLVIYSSDDLFSSYVKGVFLLSLFKEPSSVRVCVLYGFLPIFLNIMIRSSLAYPRKKKMVSSFVIT